MVYLFIGQDNSSKEAQLKKIKAEHLAKGLEHFNTDILFAKDLSLKELQEKLLSLPSAGSRRLIVIKEAEALKRESKDFIIRYAQKPHPRLILILDVFQAQRRDEFTENLSRAARVLRFKEGLSVDTFSLSRQIGLGQAAAALQVLSHLLQKGERPEWILGGLRYAWEKDNGAPAKMAKRLKLLVNCDLEIKTGRLKPAFALEKLIICLCGLRQSF